MITKTFSATLDGIQGALVQIEAVSLHSIPQIQITGLPGEVVKESRERVRACLVYLGFDVPTEKILVHLSPANIKKMGSHYDLPIALSVLAAEGRLSGNSLSEYGFIGEVALDGHLRAVRGALPLIEVLIKQPHIKKVIIPKDNEAEGALLESPKIFVAKTIGEVLESIRHEKILSHCLVPPTIQRAVTYKHLDQVMGQNLAKRALQIAIAGKHHLLFVGPPGVGKSMLSAAASSLLPEMTHEEFIEVLKIYSASSIELDSLIKTRTRPYRSPHHSISANGLLGGGSGMLAPGEVSLSHHGVLFLDEFPEYRRDAIEGLREPLQSGVLHLTRVGKFLSLPARFTLIAAMNPCPCGLFSQIENRCRCTPEKKAQYRKKLSTPILDRMALMVQLTPTDLGKTYCEERLTHEVIKESIQKATEIQRKRFDKEEAIKSNGAVEAPQTMEGFYLDSKTENWMKTQQQQYRLSFRRVNQVIKVARTIADLEGDDQILISHLNEAWGLRCFDFYQLH